MDIAIIGIGLYPFGRHDGVSAIEMGVTAAGRALADAGIGWNDVDLACAGSLEVLQPDTMNKHLGLTGIPFTHALQRLRDRRQSDVTNGQRHPRGHG